MTTENFIEGPFMEFSINVYISNITQKVKHVIYIYENIIIKKLK